MDKDIPYLLLTPGPLTTSRTRQDMGFLLDQGDLGQGDMEE